jgi:hypothetical protein
VLEYMNYDRTEILDQTTNFLYWEMDMANAAQ